MSSHQHILLTLFNIRFTLSSDLDGLAKWTDKRFPLFETYCFPSIQNQSNQDFDWLLIIDPSTTQQQRDRLQTLIQQRPRTFLIEYEDWDLVEIPINDWVRKNYPNLDKLISSRVDNDDVLHEEFMQTVRDIAEHQETECLINFMNGYCLQLSNQKHLLYEFDFAENSFMSFVEPNQTPLKTVRKYNHDLWPKEIKRINKETDTPLWMQLIHGKNVHNRIWGKAVSKPKHLTAFNLDNQIANHANSVPHFLQVLKFQLNRPFKKMRSLLNKEPY